MSIETEKRWSKKIWEYIRCPVCGCNRWIDIRYHGIFCDNCNTEVNIKNTTGDRGFVAVFNCEYVNEKGKNIIPKQCEVIAKYLGYDEVGYDLYWIWCYKETGDGIIEIDEWKPIWKAMEVIP